MSAAAVTPPVAAPAPAPAAAPVQSSTLDKPYVQIGIFSVESNARSTADTLRNAGMVPSVKEGKLSGKAFWRVVVGPAATAAERTALLEKINGLGFTRDPTEGVMTDTAELQGEIPPLPPGEYKVFIAELGPNGTFPFTVEE